MQYKDFYNDKDLLNEVKQELIDEGIWDDTKAAAKSAFKTVKKAASNEIGKRIVQLTTKATQVVKQYKPEQLQAWFEKWMVNQKQEGLGWTKELPECPCQLVNKDGKLENPKSEVFDGPLPILDPALHPGAAYELRSIGTDKGQQCCYDASGKLMTHGFGAGTADKGSPTKDPANHYKADVLPFVVAMQLDGGKHGKNVARYISVRPPNAGKGCEVNKGSKKAA